MKTLKLCVYILAILFLFSITACIQAPPDRSKKEDIVVDADFGFKLGYLENWYAKSIVKKVFKDGEFLRVYLSHYTRGDVFAFFIAVRKTDVLSGGYGSLTEYAEKRLLPRWLKKYAAGDENYKIISEKSYAYSIKMDKDVYAIVREYLIDIGTERRNYFFYFFEHGGIFFVGRVSNYGTLSEIDGPATEILNGFEFLK
ncbi:MAG: hypothetical protein ABII97_00890 [Patescibacteria group bacterium]